jgi:HKD family nuclease
MKKKVSFDFDDTLSFEIIQNYAKSLIEQGIEVHIVTSRYEDPSKYNFPCDHNDLLNVAINLSIPKSHIHFTNFENKAHFFAGNPDFIWHMDDNPDETAIINSFTNTKGIFWLDSNWKYKCNKLLDLPNETKD